MNTIKNISKLNDLVPDNLIKNLEYGATQHRKFSNIEFKIIQASEGELTVRTSQGKSLSENYADKERLIHITRGLFANIIHIDKINVQPVLYSYPKVDVVTPQWINDKMLHKSIKIKDMVTDTGIPKNSFSNWINGTKPMSQIVKSMFYFYFINK